MTRFRGLLLVVVMTCFGTISLAQKSPLPPEIDRGLFRATPGGIDEIYVFPLSASKSEMTFVSCPFVELPDGSEGTACHFETLSGAGDVLLNTAKQDVAGCAIKDHWNIDCPDFTAEGFTFSNARKLAEVVQERLQESTSEMPVPPIKPDAVSTGEATAGQLEAYRNKHFEVVEDCAAFAGDPTLQKACTSGLDTLAPAPDILGATALTVGARAFVCLVSVGWSIPACASVVTAEQ